MAAPRVHDGQPEIFYFIGRVTYRDIFGERQRTTKFCLRYAEKEFVLCPTGNSMD
jgi:hypothetical protein